MHNDLTREQANHASLFRVFLNPQNEIKFYTRNQSLTINEAATFDSNAALLSSLELFVASFISSYIFAIKKEACKENLSIEEMEASFTCNLENPLELLGVIGYDEEAMIKSIQGKIYLYSEYPEAKIIDLCQRALKKSLIYQLLNNRIDVHIEPRIISL